MTANIFYAIGSLCFLVGTLLGFIPLVGWILADGIYMAAAVLSLRLLALLYRTHARQIGWF